LICVDELQWGVAAGDDPDRDGMNNLQEYLAGCDPNDPTSALAFVDAQRKKTGEFVIRWSSVAGRYYRILRSQNLLAGFVPIAQDVAATPPENRYTDATVSGKGPYFYRVEIE